MEALLQRLINKLNSRDKDYFDFSLSEGRKYIKIIDRGESVHAFVDKKNGDIYKPASWAKPADHVRFNLFKDIEKLEEIADPFGGYLYLK